MPAKSDKKNVKQVISEYAQTIDQKVDALIALVGDDDGSKLEDWFVNQKTEGVDPDVAKAQAALEEAVQKAAS